MRDPRGDRSGRPGQQRDDDLQTGGGDSFGSIPSLPVLRGPNGDRQGVVAVPVRQLGGRARAPRGERHLRDILEAAKVQQSDLLRTWVHGPWPHGRGGHGYVVRARASEGVAMNSSRLLVTGALGRVAQQLLPGLAERYDLRLTDRAAEAGASARSDLVVGELTDPDLLDELLEGVDAVVHLAGNPDPSSSWSQLREPNVEAFAALLSAVRNHAVRRVVFASSGHAMGAYEGLGRWPVDPAWPPAPCCHYGATKAFDEALARVYSYRSPMSLIGLRLGLCADSPSPAEAVAGWTGPADLRQIVVRSLETDVRFGVYPAVSWPS